MGLAALIEPERVFPRLSGSDRPTALRGLADELARLGVVRDAEALFDKLWEREQLGSTGIGAGVAIPHCKLKGLERPVLAIGVLPEGIEYAAVDGMPVRVLFLLVSPNDSPAEHLQALAAISRWIKADRHVDKVLAATGRDEIYELLHREGG
jgi:PTS system nitrogen regulatory IIA component